MTPATAPWNVLLRIEVRHFGPLDFTVVAEVFKSRVEFAVFDITAWGEGETAGVFDKPEYHPMGSNGWPDSTPDVAKAEKFLHGKVKWDGCSDWAFDEQERVMLHACNRQGVQRLGDIMAACWDWASEVLPTFQGD